MKAIILAAGLGSRLRPLTDNRPKVLVPLREKPILDYQLETLHSCGINDICLIGGHCREKLLGYKLPVHVNDSYATTNMVYSLFCAESEFNDDLIISYGDIVYEKHVLQSLLQAKDSFSVVVDTGWQGLWQLRMADPLTDAETMILDGEGFIQQLGQKTTDIKNIQGQYIGLLSISASTMKTIRDYYHSLDAKSRSTMFMTDFIQLLIDNVLPVKAVLVNHGWLEVDTIEDWQLYENPQFPTELFAFC
ncbi:MAG: phosphocholine cytidylyltransferase family protein [Candidatus Obscuribacterales bacterium]|nr:phosphocholine cytidylyltransferase family protein [Candidatus Obscuribacterales bacterium]